MKSLAISVLFFPLTTCLFAYGDDSTVVYQAPDSETIWVTSTPITETNATVLNEKQIQKKSGQSLYDALKSVAGVETVRSGGPGSPALIFVRGAKPEQTRVFIDGVSIQDPSTTTAISDLSTIQLDDIEKIEIVRGPWSLADGGEAIGGVIRITTKKGGGKFSSDVRLEAGNNALFKQSGGVRGGSGELDYSFRASHLQTEGVSVASEAAGNTENDSYEQLDLSSSLGVRKLGLSGTFRFQKNHADLDRFGGAGGDDPNMNSNVRQLSSALSWDQPVYGDSWNSKVSLLYFRSHREVSDHADSFFPQDSSDFSFIGTSYGTKVQQTVSLNLGVLRFGVDGKRDVAESQSKGSSAFGDFSSNLTPQTVDTFGAYAEQDWQTTKDLTNTVGLRFDHWAGRERILTYHFRPSYRIPNTVLRVHGGVGTAFKTPSLYQLYSEFGNTSLNPERSLNLETGLDANTETFTVGATYFQTYFSDLIDFNGSTAKYFNQGRARSNGVEVSGKWDFLGGFSLSPQYTFTAAIDESGFDLLRRARHKAGMSLDYEWSERGLAGVQYQYFSSRDDLVFNQRVVLAPYALVNFYGSYDFSKNFGLFGRIENLFNAKYEEVQGYGVPGISGVGGVRAAL